MSSASATVSPTKTPKTEDWGLTDYSEALARQEAYVSERIAANRSDTLVLTEHSPVYTLGVRKEAIKHLLIPESQLAEENISIVSTRRGGDITYHGPGQIIGYPILDISSSHDLHAYLRNLERALIHTLGCLGLATTCVKGKTGIWLGSRKIAAIGVAVRKWVTYHGFALNVSTPLEPFSRIVPCGIPPEEGTVTSIERELGHPVDTKEVKKILTEEFWKIFAPTNENS